MKKYFALFLVMLFAVVGCASKKTIIYNGMHPRSMTPPVSPSRLRVTFQAKATGIPVSKAYALDLTEVPEVFRNEVSFYLRNGLRKRGYVLANGTTNLVIKATLSDSAITGNIHRGRKDVAMILEAYENNVKICNVTMRCSGDAKTPTNNWLPGFSAVGIYYLGENRNGTQGTDRITEMMNAVCYGR